MREFMVRACSFALFSHILTVHNCYAWRFPFMAACAQHFIFQESEDKARLCQVLGDDFAIWAIWGSHGFPVLCRSSFTVTGKTSKQCPGLDFFRNAQRNEMIDNFHSVQVHHSWSLVTLCSLIMLLVVANKVPSDPSGSCVRGCGCGVTARARGHGIQIPGIASALPSFYATVAYEKLD